MPQGHSIDTDWSDWPFRPLLHVRRGNWRKPKNWQSSSCRELSAPEQPAIMSLSQWCLYKKKIIKGSVMATLACSTLRKPCIRPPLRRSGKAPPHLETWRYIHDPRDEDEMLMSHIQIWSFSFGAGEGWVSHVVFPIVSHVQNVWKNLSVRVTKKESQIFLQLSPGGRTIDLHSLPAIMELLSIISIIRHNGLCGLFVPPLQKAASEAHHVTVRASTVCSRHTWFSQSLIIEKCPNGLSYFILAFRHGNSFSAAIEAKKTRAGLVVLGPETNGRPRDRVRWVFTYTDCRWGH